MAFASRAFRRRSSTGYCLTPPTCRSFVSREGLGLGTGIPGLRLLLLGSGSHRPSGRRSSSATRDRPAGAALASR